MRQSGTLQRVRTRPVGGSIWDKSGPPSFAHHTSQSELGMASHPSLWIRAKELGANHRVLSRPSSRRQPFRSRSLNQSEKSVEKSLKFSRMLRVEFTAASTGLTLLARVANTL